MTKAETIFAYELSLIHDSNIKQFVIDCFDKLCPDYFWTVPCSTTGKYHPQVSLGVGGLVRHTKLAIWWGIELLHALSTSPELKDIPPVQLYDEVIATLLLHDIIKNGKGLNAKGYPLDRDVTGTHGVTLAKKIVPLAMTLVVKSTDIGTTDRILAGIALHMGIWTTVSYTTVCITKLKAFAQLIHLADYCASRKVDDIYSKLQGEQNGTTKIQKETPPCPGIRKTESQATT